MRGWGGNWFLSTYIAFARYHINGNAWEQLCGAAYVPLRALGLVTFSCSFSRRSPSGHCHSSVSALFPYIAFIFTAFGVCLPITYFFVRTLLLLAWKLQFLRHFLLVGHWALRTAFTPDNGMIPVLSDELVPGCSVLGMFNSGCLQYAKEFIKSQHFVLKTEVLNWITVFEDDAFIFFPVIRKDWHSTA